MAEHPLSPPMGWRSWNCYGASISQSKMEGVFDAIVRKRSMSDGQEKSLLDLGYVNAGIDDGWQRCIASGQDSQRFHDGDGEPVINTRQFPNVADMVQRGHKLGLRVNWYMNNCMCAEWQWRKEWADLVRSSSTPKASLEQTHVWVLAHVMRRPIIVYAIHNIRNYRDEEHTRNRNRIIEIQEFLESNRKQLSDLVTREVIDEYDDVPAEIE